MARSRQGSSGGCRLRLAGSVHEVANRLGPDQAEHAGRCRRSPQAQVRVRAGIQRLTHQTRGAVAGGVGRSQARGLRQLAADQRADLLLLSGGVGEGERATGVACVQEACSCEAKWPAGVGIGWLVGDDVEEVKGRGLAADWDSFFVCAALAPRDSRGADWGVGG